MRQKKNSIGTVSAEYHISDRDDGHDDGDGSSRVWPSRTRWGSAYSLGEKFGFLLERRFGIRAFDYWYGYSACQIELMIADQPVIDYSGGKKKGSMMATRSEVDALDELTEAWEQKRQGKSFVGQTVNLDEFVKGEV